MSKRFGRNQKRAMRAKIAGLEFMANLRNEEIKEISSQLRDANTVIERTAQVLGDHFATLPVKTVEVKHILDRLKVSIFQPDRYHSIQAAVMHALDTVNVDIYEAQLHVDELRKMIHVRYVSRSGQVGYGLAQQTWLKLSDGHLMNLIEHQIAPEMAKLLVKNRNKINRI